VEGIKMRRKIKAFNTLMITFSLIAGTVACGKTSEKEKVMNQNEIEKMKEEIKEEAKEEVKEEMQTETPAQNIEQETPATEQPKEETRVEQPTVTEQPSADQQSQSDTTEHSDISNYEPPIEEGTIGHMHNEPPKNYDLDQ